MKRPWNTMRHAANVLRAVLLEIFDEAPYERFLRRLNVPSSTGAYADFCREIESAKARRPRCC